MVSLWECYIDIHFITFVFTDQLIFKGIDEGMASNRKRIIGTFSTIKWLVIYKSLKVDHCDIVFFDCTVFYVYCTCILLLNLSKFSIDICCHDLNFLFLYFDSFIITKFNIWFYSNRSDKYERLAISNFFHIDIRAGYDLKSALFCSFFVSIRNNKVCSILIKYFRTIFFLDQFTRSFSLTETWKSNFVFVLIVRFFHSLFKCFRAYLYCNFCHTVFKILYFVTHFS